MKVITFGEIMLRLAPEGYGRFVQADKFTAVYGGGEANVALSLANFGVPAAFVSKVPDNAIGQAAINSLRRYGVDTSHVALGGERLGIYYAEKGASQRPSKVIYDRAHSSISSAVEADFNWPEIFAGATWFHITGITPAISDQASQLALQSVRAAKALGLTVSCDLNYRKNLWSVQKAKEVMSELVEYVDVCIGNEEDAEKVFGIKAKATDVTSGKLNHEGYIDVAEQLTEMFGFKKVAITLRGSISANDNNWAAMLYSKGQALFSKNYLIHIVDRVGGGDSFAAGLIYGLITGMPEQEALEFAVASSCLKHTIEGDANHVTVAEVKTLMGGDGSGRVQR